MREAVPGPPTESGPARRQLWSIQYLRGAAAVLVVMHHFLHQGATSTLPGFDEVLFGAKGVDVFFVLSGFIMYTVAREERFVEFWRRRIIRVAPLYWLATAIYAVVIYAHTHNLPSGRAMLASFAFFPRYSEFFPEEIYPVLIAGWTLNYEMFFYLLFSIGILTRKVVVTTTALIGACLLAGVLFTSKSAPFVIYTSPLLLEFLAGLLIGWAFKRYVFTRLSLLFWVGLAGLLASDLFDNPILAGVCAAAMVAGALSYEHRGAVPRVRSLKLLGDASYSIYLIHQSVQWITVRQVEHAHLPPRQFIVAALLFEFLLPIGIGVLLHLILEKPLLRIVGRLLRNPWARNGRLAAARTD
jgi:exopolysaccharide production protein ExoZ